MVLLVSCYIFLIKVVCKVRLLKDFPILSPWFTQYCNRVEKCLPTKMLKIQDIQGNGIIDRVVQNKN